MTVYLDNAATSYPKPVSVHEAVQHAMTDIGASPGRASHRRARDASAVVIAARKNVADFFGIQDPEQVIFTKNATESINVVLKGWLRPGDRVLISGMEHNAVVRPLNRLSRMGVTVERIPCSPRGRIDCDALRDLLKLPPRLAALVHASNVNGALQPVEEAAELCAEAGVPLLLDAAQTAGLRPISAKDWDLGMLACSGHKALLGPPGLGILYIRRNLDVLPLMEGGTGSNSEEEVQPEHCPDRFESGTGNLPAIAGLAAGIDFIRAAGIHPILERELSLAAMLEEEMAGFPGIRLFRPDVRGTGVVSFAVEGINPGDIGDLLDRGYDIAVRTGLHCAPLAHETIGSLPEGTVRVSVGYSTTAADVEFFLKSLRSLLSRRR